MVLCCASVLHLDVEAFYLQYPWNTARGMLASI